MLDSHPLVISSVNLDLITFVFTFVGTGMHAFPLRSHKIDENPLSSSMHPTQIRDSCHKKMLLLVSLDLSMNSQPYQFLLINYFCTPHRKGGHATPLIIMIMITRRSRNTIDNNDNDNDNFFLNFFS